MYERELWGVWGAKTCAHFLAWRLGLSPGAARERLRVAIALGELPHIEAALGAGRISFSKVRAMTRVATPENDAALVDLARHATAAQLDSVGCPTVVTARPGSPPAARANACAAVVIVRVLVERYGTGDTDGLAA